MDVKNLESRPKNTALPGLAAFLLSVLSTQALAEGFEIQALQRKTQEITWRLPLVKDPDAAKAKRINEAIFLNVLGKLTDQMPPRNPQDSLQSIAPEHFRMLPELDYEVIRNDDQVLSIAITGEGCGAYCEDFELPLGFDAKTGRLLTGIDLFFPAGRARLLKDIKEQNQRKIREQILALQKPQSPGTRSKEDTQIALEMYEQCLQGWGAGNIHTEPGNMSFTRHGITFTHSRCSPHALRALDDLDTLNNSYSYEHLKPLMTGYGRAVFHQEGTSPPAWPFGQMLHGWIDGKTPITMHLNLHGDFRDNQENEIGGFYFYDKYREPLTLTGRQIRNQLTLKEYSPGKEQAQATLELTVKEGGLLGEWKSVSPSKTARVQLSP